MQNKILLKYKLLSYRFLLKQKNKIEKSITKLIQREVLEEYPKCNLNSIKWQYLENSNIIRYQYYTNSGMKCVRRIAFLEKDNEI